MQIVPPLLQTVSQDQCKPGGKRCTEFSYGIVEFLAFQIAHLADLIGVRPQRDVLLQEEDVVNFVLTPDTVASVGIMDACQIVKVLRLNLFNWYTQFVVKTPLRSQANAQGIVFLALLFDVVQWMTAASVCIGIGKGNLQKH